MEAKKDLLEGFKEFKKKYEEELDKLFEKYAHEKIHDMCSPLSHRINDVRKTVETYETAIFYLENAIDVEKDETVGEVVHKLVNIDADGVNIEGRDGMVYLQIPQEIWDSPAINKNEGYGEKADDREKVKKPSCGECENFGTVNCAETYRGPVKSDEACECFENEDDIER